MMIKQIIVGTLHATSLPKQIKYFDPNGTHESNRSKKICGNLRNLWTIKQVPLYTFLLFLPLLAKAQVPEHYIEKAMQNNPTLQAQYKAFEQAMEKVAEVQGLPDPQLSMGYFIRPIETRNGPQRAKFSLMQQFPWFGTQKAKASVAHLQAEAQYQQFIDAQQKIRYQLCKAYNPLIEQQTMERIEQENIQLLSAYKNIALSKFENNEGSMANVLRVDMMLKEAQVNLKVIQQKVKPLLANFNRYLHQPMEASIELPELAYPDTLQWEAQAQTDSAFAQHPEILAMQKMVEAGEAQAQVARKMGAPKLGVGIDYMIVGQSDMPAESSGQDALMPMVSVSLPIFRKKYKAMKKSAELSQQQWQFQQEAVRDQLKSDYEQAVFEIESQVQYYNLYQAQYVESQQTLDLLYTAYANSGKDFEEVLRMQQQLLQYKKRKASAWTKYQNALAELGYLIAD